MKFKILMAASLACNVFMGSFGAELSQPNVDISFASKVRINEHKQQLRSELYRNSWVRFATKGTLGITALAACYTMFKGFSLVQNTELNDLRMQGAKNAGQIAFLANLIESQNPTAFNGEAYGNAFAAQSNGGWGRFFANTAVSLGCGAVFNFASQKVLSHVFFDPNLKWFIEGKTSMPAIYEEMNALHENVIKKMKSGQLVLTDYQRQRHVDVVAHLFNKVVRLTEKMIGYFECKMERYNLILSDAMPGNYLFTRLNHERDGVVFKLLVEQERYKLHATADEKNATLCAMFDIITQFSDELQTVISNFAAFEDAQNK